MCFSRRLKMNGHNFWFFWGKYFLADEIKSHCEKNVMMKGICHILMCYQCAKKKTQTNILFISHMSK